MSQCGKCNECNPCKNLGSNIIDNTPLTTAIFTSGSGRYTFPAGAGSFGTTGQTGTIGRIRITLVGAGGAGGGTSRTVELAAESIDILGRAPEPLLAGGGGGGRGEYVTVEVPVAPGVNYFDYSVGLPGAGVTSGNGNDGGVVFVVYNGITYQAAGGVGGTESDNDPLGPKLGGAGGPGGGGGQVEGGTPGEGGEVPLGQGLPGASGTTGQGGAGGLGPLPLGIDAVSLIAGAGGSTQNLAGAGAGGMISTEPNVPFMRGGNSDLALGGIGYGAGGAGGSVRLSRKAPYNKLSEISGEGGKGLVMVKARDIV